MFSKYLLTFSLTAAVLPLPISSAPTFLVPHLQLPLFSSGINSHAHAHSQGIPQVLFEEFQELSKLVDISYCVGDLTGSSSGSADSSISNDDSHCRGFPGFEMVKKWSTGEAIGDSSGYIALDHNLGRKRIAVAFRGSHMSPAAFIEELSKPGEGEVYVPSSSSPINVEGEESVCEGCTANPVFLNTWKKTEEAIGDTVAGLVEEYASSEEEEPYELVLIGHSIGGAVTALAGLDFERRGWNPKVTTFGEPLIGNEDFAAYVDEKFTSKTYRRITHIKDPIPLLPLGFFPHSHEYHISQESLPLTANDIHSCTGNADQTCSAAKLSNNGDKEALWSHNEYFRRLGFCVPTESPHHVEGKATTNSKLKRDLESLRGWFQTGIFAKKPTEPTAESAAEAAVAEQKKKSKPHPCQNSKSPAAAGAGKSYALYNGKPLNTGVAEEEETVNIKNVKIDGKVVSPSPKKSPVKRDLDILRGWFDNGIFAKTPTENNAAAPSASSEKKPKSRPCQKSKSPTAGAAEKSYVYYNGKPLKKEGATEEVKSEEDLAISSPAKRSIRLPKSKAPGLFKKPPPPPAAVVPPPPPPPFVGQGSTKSFTLAEEEVVDTVEEKEQEERVVIKEGKSVVMYNGRIIE